MLAAEPSSAKDEVRLARENRGQHRRQFLRALAPVPVEKDDDLDLAAAGSDASPARRTITPARLRHDSRAGANGSLRRGIGGAVVDHHHLVHDSLGNP